MLKLKTIAAIGILAAAASASALAGTTGNGAPSGAHYNLNIIGVAKDKTTTADMTGSERHTIFVALGKTGSVQSNIYLTRGDFQVCDGNAFDTATDCSGSQVANQGAVFQLPCNTNLTGDVELIQCSDGETARYEVWARALGKPNGSAEITTCATDLNDPNNPNDDVDICSTEHVLLVRNKGQQTFKDVTDELTSLLQNVDGDPALERVSLFADGFEDWVWQYQNNGLRLAQLRFYLLPSN